MNCHTGIPRFAPASVMLVFYSFLVIYLHLSFPVTYGSHSITGLSLGQVNRIHVSRKTLSRIRGLDSWYYQESKRNFLSDLYCEMLKICRRLWKQNHCVLIVRKNLINNWDDRLFEIHCFLIRSPEQVSLILPLEEKGRRAQAKRAVSNVQTAWWKQKRQ